MKFAKIIPTIMLIALLVACQKAQKFTDQAKQMQKQGKIQQALNLYHKAIQENRRYFPAHKQLGLLYGQTNHSLPLAIHHLETARKLQKKDKQVYVNLFDLYLALGEFEKVNLLLYDARKYLPEATIEHISSLKDCLQHPLRRKKKTRKMFEKPQQMPTALLRSQAFCLQRQGYQRQAIQHLQKKQVSFD